MTRAIEAAERVPELLPEEAPEPFAPTARIVITGSPLAGMPEIASRVAAELGTAVRHTDSLMHLGWSAASDAVANWLEAPGPWVIEGVAGALGLRKWLATHPRGKPCDVVRLRAEPVAILSSGQESMRRSVAEAFEEIRRELGVRGVEIQE